MSLLHVLGVRNRTNRSMPLDYPMIDFRRLT